MSSEGSGSSLVANFEFKTRVYVPTCSQCQLDNRNDEPAYHDRTTWKPCEPMTIEALTESSERGCENCEIISAGTLNYLRSLDNSFTQVKVDITSVNRHTARSNLQAFVTWHDGHSWQSTLLEFCDPQSQFPPSSGLAVLTLLCRYGVAVGLWRGQGDKALCRRGLVCKSV